MKYKCQKCDWKHNSGSMYPSSKFWGKVKEHEKSHDTKG